MEKVILFSGKAEAGKTESAKILKSILEPDYRVAIVPYADYVKDTAKLLFGWDGKKDIPGRALLQYWGTDIVRKKEPSFWADTVVRLVEVAQDQFDYILIDDCRFPNEVNCWDGVFDYLVVRVERPGYENHLTEEQRNHISETALDRFRFDAYLKAHDKEMLECAIYDELMPLL